MLIATHCSLSATNYIAIYPVLKHMWHYRLFQCYQETMQQIPQATVMINILYSYVSPVWKLRKKTIQNQLSHP